jgi:hypothetical protein
MLLFPSFLHWCPVHLSIARAFTSLMDLGSISLVTGEREKHLTCGHKSYLIICRVFLPRCLSYEWNVQTADSYSFAVFD